MVNFCLADFDIYWIGTEFRDIWVNRKKLKMRNYQMVPPPIRVEKYSAHV